MASPEQVGGKPDTAAPRAYSSLWLRVATIAWLGGAVAGLWVVWRYDNRPGVAASAPGRWPASTSLERSPGRPTLIMLAHPRCDCTRASLGELAEALARATTRPKTYVLFWRPPHSDGWEHTDLWRAAAALPGVEVLSDEDGREASHFGSVTSGQTLVYDAAGALVFSGGITAARGHQGDNAGRTALVTLLNGFAPARTATDVFGCSLFAGL